MKRVRVLDKCVAELIAAGEIVERPASVVKELLENSIDAGADKITIEIKHGGVCLIKISDNGSGIYREDIRNAFLRNATSKISSQEDLDSIKTLGFRGEALASICAVSRVELVTLCSDEKIGTRYVIEGGEEVLFEDAGRAQGTTFTVRDLFFNTPARMKFLKKDVAEGNAVSAVVDKIAMSHPEVAIRFIRDGKVVVSTPGDRKLSSCIYLIYGKEIFDKMIPVDYSLEGIKVSGFVGRPESARASRTLQNFFINHRYAKIKIASTALEEAFKGSVMVGKHPVCVLYIDISYAAVDVNVHPAKTEVRFINERPIFRAVYYAVKSALLSDETKKRMEFKEESASRDVADECNCSKIDPSKIKIENSFISLNCEVNKKPKTENFQVDNCKSLSTDLRLSDYAYKSKEQEEKFTHEYKESKVSGVDLIKETFLPQSKNAGVQENTEDLKKAGEKVVVNEIYEIPKDKQDLAKDNVKSISSKERVILGEVFNCYIIVQEEDKLVFIDKHAAHERIIYNKLKKDNKITDSQLLLKPIVVYLDKSEYSAIIENLDLLSDSGYGVENFGEGSVIVRSIPSYLGISDAEDSIVEIAGYILDNRASLDTKYMDWLYHNIACRSAIKGGMVSSNEEILSLTDSLDKNPDIMYCPHGRPIYIELSKKDIEKQFGRA